MIVSETRKDKVNPLRAFKYKGYIRSQAFMQEGLIVSEVLRRRTSAPPSTVKPLQVYDLQRLFPLCYTSYGFAVLHRTPFCVAVMCSSWPENG